MTFYIGANVSGPNRPQKSMLILVGAISMMIAAILNLLLLVEAVPEWVRTISLIFVANGLVMGVAEVARRIGRR